MRFRVAVGLALWLGAMTSSWGATLTRTSSFEYDPATGLLTSETIEPDQAQLCLKTTYVYDSFGNKQTATTSNCGAAAGDAVIETRASTTLFGGDGRFATSATNAVGHTETRQYDPKNGTLTTLTGPNGLVTTWEYDGFGRKTAENRSDNTRSEWSYSYCSGVNGGTAACPPRALYVVQTASKAGGVQNGPTSKVYFDALNREVRSESEGFNGTSVTAVYKDTEYDSLGRVQRVSKPYFSGETVLWTSYTYDELGRVASETQPGATSGTVVTQTAYNALTLSVTVTNNGGGSNLPEGVAQSRTTVKNSQGQTVSVTDAAGNVVAYQYDPFGNLRVTTAGGVNTVLEYDLRGRKSAMVDPDMGRWTYSYDVLGQLKTQTDAKSQVTTMTYDKLGRMTQRAEADLVSTWSYDTLPGGAACGKGRLCQVKSANDYVRSYTYDGQMRVTSIATLIGSTTYTVGYGYDASSRLSQTSYPNGFVTKNVYHQLGFLQKVTDAGGSTAFWQVTSVSATGKVLGETLGNGLAQTRSYDALDRLSGSTVGALQTFGYTYDTIGNMTQRVDSTQNLTENFVYDRLNRLLQESGSGLTTKTFTYNAVGNITYKSDVGTYNYPAAGNYRPHAVSSITGTVNGYINPGFTYDGNGNMTAGMGRTLTYTSFNMPQTIVGNGYTYQYTYNADHERVRLQHSTLGEFVYLHPAGKGALLYERETKPNGIVEYKNYINAGGALIGVYIQRSDSTTSMRYFHTDHLGSVTLITNESGGVVERLAYDAFGKRRYPNGSEDPNNGLFGITTDRGFTGHEHLDEITLIHMNGRIYDPVLGRFMTSDPTLQQGDNLQNYNRYSYVNNNPLMYTDPSGYFKLGKIFRVAVAVAAIVFAPEIAVWAGTTFATAIGVSSAVGVGIVGGGLVGYVTTGTLKGALTGAATGALFAGIGDLSLGPVEKVLAHAAGGCISGMISGGSCGSGALAAGAGALIGPVFSGLGPVGEGVVRAVVGGTMSVLGGGKFANGALTAAYGYLFNELGHGALEDAFDGIAIHNGLIDAAQRINPGATRGGLGILDSLFIDLGLPGPGPDQFLIYELKPMSWQEGIRYWFAIAQQADYLIGGNGRFLPGDATSLLLDGGKTMDFIVERGSRTLLVNVSYDNRGSATGLLFYQKSVLSGGEPNRIPDYRYGPFGGRRRGGSQDTP